MVENRICANNFTHPERLGLFIVNFEIIESCNMRSKESALTKRAYEGEGQRTYEGEGQRTYEICVKSELPNCLVYLHTGLYNFKICQFNAPISL